MKDMVEKYEYHIFYSDEDDAYVGTVVEFPYLSSFDDTPEGAYKNIKDIVKEGIEILKEEGKEPPVPLIDREFKGNISLRLSPETHRMAAQRAREEGCSLNQFLTSLIERNLYSNLVEKATSQLVSAVSKAAVVCNSVTVSSFVHKQNNLYWPVGGSDVGSGRSLNEVAFMQPQGTVEL